MKSPFAQSIRPSHDVPDRCMPVTRTGTLSSRFVFNSRVADKPRLPILSSSVGGATRPFAHFRSRAPILTMPSAGSFNHALIRTGRDATGSDLLPRTVRCSEGAATAAVHLPPSCVGAQVSRGTAPTRPLSCTTVGSFESPRVNRGPRARSGEVLTRRELPRGAGTSTNLSATSASLTTTAV